ncbi:hypothetical protein [Streptomyces djakartensis]|uniref:Sulfite exporter TauE/SafE family protein n=1 Tax=Streptomyces djakartensis TaxID=68193 RepID=A0ABQ2ZG59_9ACTN|nr:hypothetical protein [Streptomyces djakartensis]GGY12512.1 hypothetical protein GCM10010384_17230 [Streptomyces djakartensis]
MPGISLTVIVLLCLAALAAGWIDAVAGGGGLLLSPALLSGGRVSGQFGRRLRRGRQGARPASTWMPSLDR